MTDDSERILRRQAERRADMKLAFRSHLIAYVLVNAGLVAIDLFTSPGLDWAYWPMLGWGLGLAAHGAVTYFDGMNDRERLIEAELEKLRKR